MININILDCTLRDGGYINNWEFGTTGIDEISFLLSNSNINIIELGYLSGKASSKNFSLYRNIEKCSKYIPANSNSMFVAMLEPAKEKTDYAKIPSHKTGLIDGIRLAFNKEDVDLALNCGEKLQKKGYKIFLHPCKTNFYTKKEFLNLIKKVNKIKPYALYIVDSFGAMYEDEISQYLNLLESNLSIDIKIGFHSHNNLQLSFSNSVSIIKSIKKHDLIIDTTISGMGRGAGNLATELMAEYLNRAFGTNYKIDKILKIYSKYLADFYANTPWGYSFPYFLSAVNNCHPEYASFLVRKKITCRTTINKIYEQIPPDKKKDYNESIIKKLSLKYVV